MEIKNITLILLKTGMKLIFSVARAGIWLFCPVAFDI